MNRTSTSMANLSLVTDPPAAPEPLPARAPRNWPLITLYLLSLATLLYFTVTGWDFYTTPLIERPHHPDYWSLKPGGSLGRSFGVIGAGLMTLMLSYSMRKRIQALSKLGRLRSWLDYHIYCGVIGPLFIVLHSSFKVTGVVALSFWSMVLVASSGVIGRYLYLQIPRRRSGNEMSFAEAGRYQEKLGAQLVQEYGVSGEALQRLDSVARASVDTEAGLFKTLSTMPLATARMRWRVRALTRRMADHHRTELRELLEARALLARRIALWSRLQELFHYWHVFHKPFAVIMYIFAAVHIGVAIATGYAFG